LTAVAARGGLTLEEIISRLRRLRHYSLRLCFRSVHPAQRSNRPCFNWLARLDC
jgi:hypothetical protein